MTTPDAPLTAADLEAAGIRVRELEWDDILYNRSDEEPVPEVIGHEAAVGDNAYYVIKFEAEIQLERHDSGWNILGTFVDPEAAKNAAQADYTARILAALERVKSHC